MAGLDNIRSPSPEPTSVQAPAGNPGPVAMNGGTEPANAGTGTDQRPKFMRTKAAGSEVELDYEQAERYIQKGIGAEKEFARIRAEADAKVAQADAQLKQLREQMTDYDGYVTFVDLLRRPEQAAYFREFTRWLRTGEPLPTQHAAQAPSSVHTKDPLDSYYDGQEPQANRPPAMQPSGDPRFDQLFGVIQQQQQMIQQLSEAVSGIAQKDQQREQQTQSEQLKSTATQLHNDIVGAMVGSETLKRVPDQAFVYRQIRGVLEDLYKEHGSIDVPLATKIIEQHYGKLYEASASEVFARKREERTTFDGAPPDGILEVTPAYQPKPNDLGTGKTLGAAKAWLKKMGYKNL